MTLTRTISDVLGDCRDDVVRHWVNALVSMAGTSFVARPADELEHLCVRSCDALIRALDGSFGPMRDFVEEICPLLAARGVRLAEAERALLTFKEICWPYLAQEFRNDVIAFMNAVQHVDNCLNSTIFEFAEAYQQLINRDVQGYVREVEEIGRKLEQLAILDSLTGLYNHRYFQDRLRGEIHRAGRYHRSVGLVMLDIDRFKRFNDHFGHPSGDQAICQIASQLRSGTRDVDIAARYGGEEFALILPETDYRGALAVAERIRGRVERMIYVVGDGGRGAAQLTVSAGVACFPAHAAQAPELIELADKALYRAKSLGRNRTVVSAAVAAETSAPG